MISTAIINSSHIGILHRIQSFEDGRFHVLLDESKIPLAENIIDHDFLFCGHLDDKEMIEKVLGIINVKSPKHVVFSLPPSILHTPKEKIGNDFGCVLIALYRSGYNVSWRSFDSSDYGYAVRQSRCWVYASNIQPRTLVMELAFPGITQGRFGFGKFYPEDEPDDFKEEFFEAGDLANDGNYCTKQCVVDYHGRRKCIGDFLKADRKIAPWHFSENLDMPTVNRRKPISIDVEDLPETHSGRLH